MKGGSRAGVRRRDPGGGPFRAGCERSLSRWVGRTVAGELRPIPGAPALVLEPREEDGPRYVIIADLHLGLGATPERPLGPPEAHVPRLASDLAELARRARAAGIVIAGDAKHPIVGVPPALRTVLFDFSSDILARGLSLEVIVGNHDVGLARYLPREVTVHAATGLVRYGVGIFHGHRWPSARVLQCESLVVGHLHPGVRFAPTTSDPMGKRRCWLRIEFPSPKVPRRGRRRIRAKEMVVIPAFNPVAGTEALNRDRPGRGKTFLYRRFLVHGNCRAYLLDSTDVGSIRMPWPGLRPHARAPSGR